MKERKHSSNITCMVGRSTETSRSRHPTGSKYRDDIKDAARSRIPMVRAHASQECGQPVPRDWAHRLLLPCNLLPTVLISAASLLRHITPEVPKNSRRTFFCCEYSMRFSQAAFALSSLATACEAFRFTVWLGDKCTISGTGTKPSDQELLIIPQTVDDDGCMVRALANIRLAVYMN